LVLVRFCLCLFIVVRDSILDFSVFSPFLVVISTSATDCRESVISKVICYVLSGTLNSTTTTATTYVCCVENIATSQLCKGKCLALATPAAPGHVLGSVTPDVLLSRQHHCNVDKWQSLDVRCGADRPPTMENGPCAAVPL